jgi:hypothetical protein
MGFLPFRRRYLSSVNAIWRFRFFRHLAAQDITIEYLNSLRLNPRDVAAAVLDDRSSPLSKQLVDHVVYQLYRKCRDVELSHRENAHGPLQ